MINNVTVLENAEAVEIEIKTSAELNHNIVVDVITMDGTAIG